ncbi:MAG TPA: MJ0042-type zinc finger domain-containing protein, partial [Schlesneria sp.]
MSIAVTCSGCEAKFQVKDEFAGRKVRCSECDTVIDLRPTEELIVDFPLDSTLDPAFQRDKFLLHQKLLSINTRYAVCDETGKEIMHVLRPTHVFRTLVAMFAIIFEVLLVVSQLGFDVFSDLRENLILTDQSSVSGDPHGHGC